MTEVSRKTEEGRGLQGSDVH